MASINQRHHTHQKPPQRTQDAAHLPHVLSWHFCPCQHQVFAPSVNFGALYYFFFSLHAGFHPSEYSRQKRISTPFVKERGLFMSVRFSFQVHVNAFLPKPTVCSQNQPGNLAQLGGKGQQRRTPLALCRREKCKHRDGHWTETICTATRETKSKNKGQETQEQKLCLFPGGGIVLGGCRDHGTACPGRICRRSTAEAGTGCCCAWRRAEVRSETPGMYVTS